jgi:hypothetical protein
MLMSKYICFKVREDVYEKFLLLDYNTKEKLKELLEALIELISR